MLRALDPDVVCLQESPRGLRWRARLAALARTAGLTYVAGGRSAGDCALLAHVRVDVAATAEVLLPRRPRLHQRGVALAVVRRSGVAAAVASVHLGLDAAERREHARLVRAAVDDLGTGAGSAPVVIGADLNEPPGGPAWRVLGAGLADVVRTAAAPAQPTFPARRPKARIDALLVGPGLEAVAAGVPPRPAGVPPYERATDHLPVLARLRRSG